MTCIIQNIEISLQIASCMAGISFNSSGLGITHSIAHGLGSSFHLPHGLCNAIVLPYIIEFNGRDAKTREKYIRILEAMGASNINSNSQLLF